MSDDERLQGEEQEGPGEGEEAKGTEPVKDVGAGTPLQIGETYRPARAPAAKEAGGKGASETGEPRESVTPRSREGTRREIRPPAQPQAARPPAADRESEEVHEPSEAVPPGSARAPQGDRPGEDTAVTDQEQQAVDYESSFRTLKTGDVVSGEVVHVDREGVLVDVGTKSEGLVPFNELARRRDQQSMDVVSVGDKIDVYVLQTDDEEHGLLLSKKRADFERAWEKILDAHENGSTLHAMVTDRVKGGLVVDLGLRGFVPASHSGVGKVHNLDKLVGQSIPLRVIEVDRERRKVILSHRLALEQEKASQRSKTLATIAEGQIREGIVRRLTNYGAFVDLGGIDGLLHISEMSWTRINHPGDVVKVGDKIQVVVLKLNLNEGKISLGMRQILPDPWSEVSDHFSVGDIVPGRVTRIVPFGAFVQLQTGIEGIVPNIELAEHRVTKPEQVVSVKDKVNVKILDINPEERRMTLSLREAPQPEPKPQSKPKSKAKERGEAEAAETAAEGEGEEASADLEVAESASAEMSAPESDIESGGAAEGQVEGEAEATAQREAPEAEAQDSSSGVEA
jgi:ribosomal protein S1